MPVSTAYLAADLAFAINELPATVSYGGAAFGAVFEDRTQDGALSLNGDLVQMDAQVICRVADFASQPTERARLDVRHVSALSYTPYRIQSVNTAADSLSYTIALARWNRT